MNIPFCSAACSKLLRVADREKSHPYLARQLLIPGRARLFSGQNRANAEWSLRKLICIIFDEKLVLHLGSAFAFSRFRGWSPWNMSYPSGGPTQSFAPLIPVHPISISTWWISEAFGFFPKQETRNMNNYGSQIPSIDSAP